MNIISQFNHENYINQLVESLNRNLKNITNPNNFNFTTTTYANIIEAIAKTTNEIAISALLNHIEYLDSQFKNSDLRKREYYLKELRERTIITVFGEVTYKRYIYEHKHSKKCYTHVDRKLGLVRYDRFDPCVKALIVEKCSIFNSMIKVGKIIGEEIFSRFSLDPLRKLHSISRQTIYNIYKKSKMIKPEVKRQTETPKTIFIMADEKFIASQQGPKTMIKQAVIYEGLSTRNKRNKLINPYITSHIGPDIWYEVYNNLALLYDTDKIEEIYILGDGATWIKSGVNIIPNSKYALDKFHLKQAINHISQDELVKKILFNYIINDRKDDYKRLIKFLIHHQQRETRKETIKEKSKYIKRNWQATHVMYKEVFIGCPMESAISHNIASIFSSVPKAYNRDNLEKYLSYRDLELNGYDIRELSIKSNDSEEEVYETSKPLNWSMFEKRRQTDKANSSNWLKGFISKQ